jgi:hypothetical protein
MARAVGASTVPGDVVHEGIDIGRGIAAEVDVIGVLVHVERQHRRAAGQAVGVVGRPDVAERTVAR